LAASPEDANGCGQEKKRPGGTSRYKPEPPGRHRTG
jgi:hypothetical protein